MALNYITLDFLILIFPLILSFKWKFKYYKYYKPLFASIAIVGISYIIWDVIVTFRGDWWFNKEYLIGLEIAGLPIEEILFFIVVPYSCIFIYENFVYFIKDKEIFYNKYFYYIISILFLITGLIFYHQDYTILSLLSCALFFFVANKFYPSFLKSRLFWFYIILSFVAFMIFNYLLTSTIIVFYNPEAIWGIRITTIPLEDFFYNFSMLSFYLMFYLIFKNKFIKNKVGK
jgi:lycopene cyclase domain-containing protein